MGTQLVVAIDSSRRTVRTQSRCLFGSLSTSPWHSSLTTEPWSGIGNYTTLRTPAWPSAGGTLKAMRYDRINASGYIGRWPGSPWDLLPGGQRAEWCLGYETTSLLLSEVLARPGVAGALLVETIGFCSHPASNGTAWFAEAEVLGDYP